MRQIVERNESGRISGNISFGDNYDINCDDADCRSSAEISLVKKTLSWVIAAMTAMISVWFPPNSHSSCLFSLPAGPPWLLSTYPLSPPPISSSFTLHSGPAVRTTLTLASPSQELLSMHKTDGKAESGRKTRSA